MRGEVRHARAPGRATGAKAKTARKPSGSGKRPPPSRGKGGGARAKRGLVGRLVSWALTLVVWGAVAVAAVVIYYGARMPQMSDWAVPDRDPVVTLVGMDGEAFAQRGTTTAVAGAALPLDEMSPWLPLAVIAIEDRRFRSHWGVDPIGLARAMAANVQAGRLVQGGSTLTQQLAKNVFLSPDRSLERKVQEALMALWLEQKFSKDRILELYLNRVFFGHNATGVEAASQRYFGHSASDLSLMEAAILAGSLKAPSRLNPESHPRDSAARASVVLAAMEEMGFITAEQRSKALTTAPSEAPRLGGNAMRWASEAVMRELRTRVPEITSDLRVETTVSPDLQAAAATVLRDAVASVSSKGADQGAVVLMDGAGSVRALVGGVDYAKSQFDRASRAKRQPGSAFKVFTFLAAIEKGLDPASIAYDEPVEIDGWSPKNYTGTYRGPVTLEEAFAASLNTVAAQIVAYVGAPAIKSAAERLGVRTELNDNLSLSLGTSEVTPLELTLAYAPFSNGGYAPEPHLIQRVEDAEGTVLYERELVQDPLVVRPDTLAKMQSMLRAVVEGGTGVKARLPGVDVGGKTGTSQSYRDAWFVGTVPGWVATVWIGNDAGKPMDGVTGGSAPATAWARLMRAVLNGDVPRPVESAEERWVTLPPFAPEARVRPAAP